MTTTTELPPPILTLTDQQAFTLATPRRRAGLVARSLFTTMDLLYGRRRSLEKFLVLELVARVPYQTWEHAATEACSCSVAADYGCSDNFADVLRQVALDERHHRDESLDDLERVRAQRSSRPCSR